MNEAIDLNKKQKKCKLLKNPAGIKIHNHNSIEA